MDTSMLLPLRRYADFRRRAGRTEFWSFTLLLVVAGTVLVFLDQALGLGGSITSDYWTYGWGAEAATRWNGGLLTKLFMLAMLVPALAVSVRRLHDVSRAGWWLLVGFVPFVGWLLLLFFYVQPSWPASNRWGAPAAGESEAP